SKKKEKDTFHALTALELTTLPTIMKEVYGNPVTEEKEEDEDNFLVKSLKFAGSTAKGVGTGAYKVGEETVVGVYNTVAHPIQTGTAMWDTVSHPIDTSKYIKDRKSTRLNSSHVSISYA